MSTQEILAAAMLGVLALLILGAMAYSVLTWARRRSAMRSAAAAAGFSMIEGPSSLANSAVTGFREFRAASPGEPGKGRFDNILLRRVGGITLYVFDYAAGSSAGGVLLPQGTYACFLIPWGVCFPAIRITPRPTPLSRVVRNVLKQLHPSLEATDIAGAGLAGTDSVLEAFTMTYVVESDSGDEVVSAFLSPEKIAFLAQARPPWFVEIGREGMVLARRPGGTPRFHSLAPEELRVFAEATLQAFEVLAPTNEKA